MKNNSLSLNWFTVIDFFYCFSLCYEEKFCHVFLSLGKTCPNTLYQSWLSNLTRDFVGERCHEKNFLLLIRGSSSSQKAHPAKFCASISLLGKCVCKLQPKKYHWIFVLPLRKMTPLPKKRKKCCELSPGKGPQKTLWSTFKSRRFQLEAKSSGLFYRTGILEKTINK